LNKLERVILRKLAKNLYAMDKRDLTDGIPESSTDISNALARLRELGYVIIDLTSSNCVVSVPEHMRKDVFKIVFPGSIGQEEIPMEDQIPEEYDKIPLFKAKGEKTIKDANAEYWFCPKTSERDYVTCFIFMRGILTHRVNLGSLADFGSLVSQALRNIDNLFEKRPFLKSDLVHRLPHDIVGNRQPIKAITEYLCYEKYLVRMDGSKFQRTGKIHVVSVIDEIAFSKKEEKPGPLVFQSSNGAFGYDDDGLYPILR
jgi:hypothetical protein